jgi:hypothetical protein
MSAIAAPDAMEIRAAASTNMLTNSTQRDANMTALLRIGPMLKLKFTQSWG